MDDQPKRIEEIWTTTTDKLTNFILNNEPMKEVAILNDQQIRDKIKRIAFQILETHIDSQKLVLAGIASGGYVLAQLISHELSKISNIDISLCEVVMNKSNPNGTVVTSLSPKLYENQCIVLVDDVLNSGSTLIYGVCHFLQVPLRQFKTAVLVDRSHKKYPIKADFKGISLSTSIQETVSVDLTSNLFSAVLK